MPNYGFEELVSKEIARLGDARFTARELHEAIAKEWDGIGVRQVWGCLRRMAARGELRQLERETERCSKCGSEVVAVKRGTYELTKLGRARLAG